MNIYVSENRDIIVAAANSPQASRVLAHAIGVQPDDLEVTWTVVDLDNIGVLTDLDVARVAALGPGAVLTPNAATGQVETFSVSPTHDVAKPAGRTRKAPAKGGK